LTLNAEKAAKLTTLHQNLKGDLPKNYQKDAKTILEGKTTQQMLNKVV
jgi:hypothetical protein